MRSITTYVAAVVVFLLASDATAHYSISSCQNKEISYVTKGVQYKICPGSDYQGTTLYAYPSVASHYDCAQKCQLYDGCSKAVWDSRGGTCFIKAKSGLNWVADDAGLETSRFDKSGPTQGTPLISCPFDVQTYTTSSGLQYQVCPSSDFQGTTLNDVHGLNSDQDCADACSRYNGCYKAVYDVLGKTCHLKANCGVQLVANPYADAIWFLGAPACTSSTTTTTAPTTATTTTAQPPATTTAASGLCPNGAVPDRTYTASNGDIYGICSNTDFPGGDIQSPVYNVPTIEACADVCSKLVGCIASNLHKSSQICYLKGAKNTSVINSAVDGAYLIREVNTNTRTGTTIPFASCATVTVTVTASAY